MNLKDYRTKFGFEPKLHFYEAEYFLGGMARKEANSDEIHGLVRKITGLAVPSYVDKFDRKWDSFYLPLRRSGKIVAMPVYVGEYQKNFTVSFRPLGVLQVNRGKEEPEEWFVKAFKEILRFISVVKKSGNAVIEKTIPWDFRTGKIKGKHVMQNVMPESQSEKLLKRYEEHVSRQPPIAQASLEDYLDTAATCYRPVYGRKAAEMTPEQMYRRWADGRHGGMLDIADRKSAKAFSEWQHGGRGFGSHPFEIVFSWFGHGIHLYPPSQDEPCYKLYVTDYALADAFIAMLEALMKNGVPVKAPELKEVLEYLAGESYFTVNDYDRQRIFYSHAKEERKLFKHIEWDAVNYLKWR